MHDPKTFDEIINSFTDEQHKYFIELLHSAIDNNHDNTPIEHVTGRVIDIMTNIIDDMNGSTEIL